MSEVEARANARLGTVLRGKYRLTRVLGMGGMAVVYEGAHRNQKRFAVRSTIRWYLMARQEDALGTAEPTLKAIV